MKQNAQDPLNRSRANFVTDEEPPMADSHGTVSLATTPIPAPTWKRSQIEEKKAAGEIQRESQRLRDGFQADRGDRPQVQGLALACGAAPHR